MTHLRAWGQEGNFNRSVPLLYLEESVVKKRKEKSIYIKHIIPEQPTVIDMTLLGVVRGKEEGVECCCTGETIMESWGKALLKTQSF